MAVDLAIPLITNIKCAKLFVSAISSRNSFEISSLDCQTTHASHTLPGLINVSPIKAEPGIAVKGGFTFLANMLTSHKVYCDYSLATNSFGGLGSTLFIDESNVALASKAFKEWTGRIITKPEYLSTALLLSNLYSKPVHITKVYEVADLELILLSREKGVTVTFDVDVHDLFRAGSEHLWESFTQIDCLSAHAEFDVAILLLLTGVHDEKLSLTDITEKMCNKPREIFGLPDQPDTFIEVELDCADLGLGHPHLFGSLHRVVIRGKTVLLDGNLFAETAGLQIIQKPSQLFSPGRKLSFSASSPMRTSISNDKSPRARLFCDVTQPQTVRFEGDVDLKRKSIVQVNIPSYLADTPPQNSSSFFKKHVTSVTQFQRSDLHVLFGVAQEMKSSVEKRGKLSALSGKIMCSAFWEPSTRTSCSFETAMVRLGGEVVSVNQITSSIAKGESLTDTGKPINLS